MNLTRRNFLKLSAASSLSLFVAGCSGESTAETGSQLSAYQSDSGLSYWLYTPQNQTDKPLILYLHGGSGKGSDLKTILSVDGFPRDLQEGSLFPDAFVVIPQLPAECRGWSERSEQLLRLLSELKQRYSIRSISMTGHSMGGTGTWDLALKYPDVFSAIAPLSGSIQNTPQAVEALQNMPVWAIVGSDDTIVSPEMSVVFMEALQAVNPHAKLTVLEGFEHSEVPKAYLDPTLGLMDWLTTVP